MRTAGPGDLHVHFFGADAFSFGAGVRTVGRRRDAVSFEGFGRPLRNVISVDSAEDQLVSVRVLG